MTRSSLCFLALFGLALQAIAPRTAHAAQSYSNCTGFITSVPAVISTPGTWCLNQNLSTAITSGVAIEILSDNVTVDCNDFKLDGLAAGLTTQAYGIGATNFHNATVRHCNIRGFFAGLRIIGTEGGHLIEDNRLDDITYYGMLIEGNGSVIRRNRIFDTGGTTAVANPASGIDTNYGVDILDNVVSGVASTSGSGANAFGMYVYGNLSGSISGNQVRGIAKDGAGVAYGIYNDSTDRVTMRNNDLVGDASIGSRGLSCDGPTGRAKDNAIKGFATGISGCSNDGGNVVKP